MKLSAHLLLSSLTLTFALSTPAHSLEIVALPALAPTVVNTLLAEGLTVFYADDSFSLALADPAWIATLEGHALDRRVVGTYEPEQQYYLISTGTTPDQQVAVEGEILFARSGRTLYRGSFSEALWLQGPRHGLIHLDPSRPIERVLPSAPDLPADELTPGQIALIEQMVGEVNRPRINRGVDILSTALPNRKCWKPEGRLAGEGIENYFASIGFDSLYTQPVLGGISSPNIVGVLPGAVNPDQVVLVGGHYDSITTLFFNNDAPGADDNASGTSTVLEAARVMRGYEFERTLIFVAFSGEEIGLFGSDAFATMAKNTGMDLRGVVNIDMDGYLADGDVRDLEIVTNDNSMPLFNHATAAAAHFVPELPTVQSSGIAAGSSDHASFWSKGFQAVWFFEDDDEYSPWIHTRFDTVGQSYNDPELAWRTTQVVVATLASLAAPVE